MGITRQALIERAEELGCYEDPENHTDQELLDAIKAEQSAEIFLDKFAALPTDEARREAAQRLRMDEWPEPKL